MKKTIGIIGGMSPESTSLYYQLISRRYLERYGKFDYPEIIIYSVDHQKYLDWRKKGRHDLIIQGFISICNKLKDAGADFAIIATNTMHYYLPEIKDNISIPIISIIDAVGRVIKEENISKVGLLGTKFTMNSNFYKEGLHNYNIDVVVPCERDQDYINKIIFSELARNIILKETKDQFLRIINELENEGSEGIILGCTEIPILIKQSDTSVKLFDTLSIHAEAALNFALGII